MIHRGYVDEDGTLLLESPSDYEKQLEKLKGRRVKLELRRAQPARTLNQNSWYWGVMLKAAAEQTGNDLDDIHQELKARHLPPEVRVVLGNRRATYTTTDLTVEEMSTYLEKCRATLAQFGVEVEECEAGGG